MLRLDLRTPFVTFLFLLFVTSPARAATPFTGWADGAASAAAAIAAGDAEAALRAARSASTNVTAGEAGSRARLLAARALELGRRPGEAAAEIASLLPSLPVTLAPAARARGADDLDLSGHPAEAAAAWAAASAGASPADLPSFAAAEARAWLSAGEPLLAARAAAAGGADPAARLALARAWAILGDPRAPAALRALATDRVGEPEAETAARLLGGSGPGSFPGVLTVPDRIDRARHLLASGRTALAIGELDAVDAASGGAPLPATTVMRAMAFLQSGRPDEAERIAAPVAALPGPGEPGAARFVLARAAARQGRIDEAVTRYRQVSRERPVVPGLTGAQQADLPDDAAFLAAWLPYDAGRFSEVATGLRRFLRERPAARRAPDARWFLAWSLLRSGDRSAARAAFRDVAEREPGQPRAAALYWLGRTDPGPGAVAAYQAAFAEVPGGWYALLAASRLERLSLATPAVDPLPPSPLPDPPRDPRLAASLALAVDLAGAGLREESVALLLRLSRAPDARSHAVHLAEVAAFCGDAEVPYRMARDFLPPGVRAQRWSYPDALPDVLGPTARALGVDPSLALAVMRRESAFVALARSGAAAEGLLQLRPETARRLAWIAGLPGESDLSDPAANTRLGVAYLGLLSDRFPEPAQALAAYNAGPAAAEKWSRARAGLPLDEWVEDIPYRETRQYVRAVLADRARYRKLAGDAQTPLDPSAPVSPAGPGAAF
jgi:soluble lytic murein transglycosylase